MIRPFATLVAALCLAAPPAAAQTGSFDTDMATALAGSGTATPLIRCTALFRAFRLLAGEGTELASAAAARETELAVASVSIWQANTGSGDLDAAFDAIVPIIGAATGLYLDRMRANQVAGGSVFDADLEPELAYCGALHDRIAAGTD